MTRWTPPLIGFALCAALAFGMLGGCGVASDSICHPVNNPCAGALICSGGACVERCDVNPSVCPAGLGCDRSTGTCAAFCSFGFCQPPAVCFSGLCVKP